MHSVKSNSSKNFYSPKVDTVNLRSCVSPQASSAGIIGTKEQQQRIEKLINEVRRGGPISPEAIVLSQTEINRMRNAASFLSKDQLLQMKKVHEEQIEKQHATSKAKKAKMMQIEAERKKNVPLSEVEKENIERDQALRERAQNLLDEERDEVKHMNKMILYAQVVTTRDKQLKEKKLIGEQLKREEKAKDLVMEIDRLKKIKYYEEVDAIKLGQQKAAAAHTLVQIKENELIRQKAREERDREGQEMIQKIKEKAIEDAKENFARKKHQKDLLDMVYEANQKAIANKQAVYDREREEEEKIIKYNIEKARKDAEYQAEVKRIKDAKEAETIRLRKLQEKFADRQAEIDAIRAKRAFEQADRLAREKERKEAEHRSQMNEELLAVRKLQGLEKERRLQEQAKVERDEFQRIIQNQKIERELEEMMEEEKRRVINDHANQLKKQIAINEEKKMQSKRMSLEEGKKIKDKLYMEKMLLKNLKTKKIKELNSYDIPTKYTTELNKKRIII